MTTIVRVWSGPRNISTALMRAWENRADTAVMDEPLYAHFLNVTGIDHPGRADIVHAGPTDLRAAVRGCVTPELEAGQTVSYQKHMAHHLLPHIGLEWIGDAVNFLLVRHPRRVIASYAKVRHNPTLEDLGFPQLVELQQQFGPLPVIEADNFLANPEAGLRSMCHIVGIDFDSNMLSWPTGPRSTDGVWGRYWYATVESSTEFGRSPDDEPSELEIPAGLVPVADEAAELYDRLMRVDS